jgi:glycosyltransferase involved in cell wall biosynthesis
VTPTPVVYYTDSRVFGGAEEAMRTLVAHLDRERWLPTLAYHPSPELAPLVDASRALEVDLWPFPPFPAGAAGIRRVPAFARALRARHAVVFHAHLRYQSSARHALVAAAAARIEGVVATLQLFIDTPLATRPDLKQRILARCAGRYIAVSAHVAARARDQLGWPPDRIRVIPNAIEVERFSHVKPDSRLRAELTGDTGRRVVLVPARLVEQKGHRYLLEAAQDVPSSAVFVLAGEGPEREPLERYARELGVEDRIRFLGRRTDIPEVLAASDLMVLPSLCEGLPLSILEAMGARRPVIATDIGGTNEAIVDGTTGLLVPPADPPALAAAVRRLLDDPALAALLADAGWRRVAERFTAAAMAARVTSTYDELLQRGHR